MRHVVFLEDEMMRESMVAQKLILRRSEYVVRSKWLEEG
jgi:hypothetical protein